MELSIAPSSPGILVLSEIHYPGWRATVDGSSREVLRVDWNLRGVRVEPGESHVTLEFRPRTFRAGAFVTFLTLLASAFLVWLGRRRRATFPLP
jgi:uncharacterized membrane protein YfhO